MPIELREQIMSLRDGTNDYRIIKTLGLSSDYFNRQKKKTIKKKKVSTEFVKLPLASREKRGLSLSFALNNGTLIEVYQ